MKILLALVFEICFSLLSMLVAKSLLTIQACWLTLTNILGTMVRSYKRKTDRSEKGSIIRALQPVEGHTIRNAAKVTGVNIMTHFLEDTSRKIQGDTRNLVKCLVKSKKRNSKTII